MLVRKLIFVFVLICSVASAKQVNEGLVSDAIEYQVLKDFYTNMGGASWIRKANWPTIWPAAADNTQFGTWEGVVVVDGDISGIYMTANNVTGSIPSSIGQLTRLRGLGFENNHITGSIPSTIGNIPTLWRLTLNINQITGSIPATINNCTLLNEIWLNNNQLSGSVPSMNNLTLLEILNLGDNQLTGTLPSDFFSGFGWVHTLRLGNNTGLTGSLPSVSPMAKLQRLDLMSCHFTGPLPDGFTTPNLMYLMLAANQFSGPIPSSYGSLGSLQIVALSDNQLSGPIPPSIGSLSHLARMSLSNNQLTQSIPSTFSNLTSLNELYLTNNQLSGDLSVIASMNALTEAWLDNNNFTGVPSFSGAANRTNLQLVIRDNDLTMEDLTPLYTSGTSGFRSISIAPQPQVDTEKTVQAPAGGSLTLTTTIDRNASAACTYQWFKKVGETVTPLNVASTNGHTVVITVTGADAGTKYLYHISHPVVPLTLISRQQTLEIIECNTPTMDFATEELNGMHTFNPSFTGGGCTPTYTWDFGDGATSTEQAATHTYSETGTFTVTLTVSYTCGPCPGGQLTTSHEVTIENGFCGSIYCDGAGGVGIGTRVTDGFRLSVNGKIRASDIIKVYPQNQWSDFVFEKDYKLRSLNEVEKFIKQNGHLPEIPSAKEVETEGIDLGGMDAKLLQKIEELTLYMIELKKENEAIKKQLDTLSKRKK
jgi:Leucine-rich repeat (LRR) protein